MTTSMLRAATTASIVNLSALAQVATAASTRALVLRSRLSARRTPATRTHFARNFVTAISSKPPTPTQTSAMQQIIPQAARPSQLKQQFRAAHFRSRARQMQRSSAPNQKQAERSQIDPEAKPVTEESFSEIVSAILVAIVAWGLGIGGMFWLFAYIDKRKAQLQYERSQRMIVASLAIDKWISHVCENPEYLSKMELNELEQFREDLGIPSSHRRPDEMTTYIHDAVMDFSRSADDQVLSLADKIVNFVGH